MIAEVIKIKLIKSLIGRKDSHIKCAKSLGLRKIGQVVEVVPTPENLGMVKHIEYLLKYEA